MPRVYSYSLQVLMYNKIFINFFSIFFAYFSTLNFMLHNILLKFHYFAIFVNTDSVYAIFSFIFNHYSSYMYPSVHLKTKCNSFFSLTSGQRLLPVPLVKTQISQFPPKPNQTTLSCNRICALNKNGAACKVNVYVECELIWGNVYCIVTKVIRRFQIVYATLFVCLLRAPQMTPKVWTFMCNGSLYILTAVLSMSWILVHSPTERQKTLPTVIT